MRRATAPSCLVIALGWLGATEPCRAAELEITAAVTVASDYFFRGVSQTRNEAAVQADLGIEHPSGWFGGVFVSTVNFPNVQYVDDRNLELDAHLGYGRELGRGWAAIARAARYAYANADRDHDYNELGLGLQYRGLTASVGYTGEALGYGGSGRIWELVGNRPLAGRLALNAGVGWYELTQLDDDYAFWHLGVQRPVGRFVADLGYYGSDAAGRRLFGERAEGRLVLGLSYALR